MSLKNVDVVRGLGAAFEQSGANAFSEYFDPEIEWHEDPSFPEAGVYRGMEAVVAYAAQFMSEFSEIHYEVGDTIDLGDHVVANMNVSGVGRTSGAEFKISAWWALTLRNEKIIRCFAYLDRAQALAAVGSSD